MPFNTRMPRQLSPPDLTGSISFRTLTIRRGAHALFIAVKFHYLNPSMQAFIVGQEMVFGSQAPQLGLARRAPGSSMEVRNDSLQSRIVLAEYRFSGIARQYIHASFLWCNPQHAGCRHGRQYAGAVAISFTQSDAPDVTSASASLA